MGADGFLSVLCVNTTPLSSLHCPRRTGDDRHTERRCFRDLDIDASGDLAVVQAAAVTVVYNLEQGWMNLFPSSTRHLHCFPGFVDRSKELIVQILSSDIDFSKLEPADFLLEPGMPLSPRPEGVSPGRYRKNLLY